MMDKTVRLLLKTKRANMRKVDRVRTRKLHTHKPMVYPFAVEKAYKAMITSTVQALILYTKQEFAKNGERILRGDSEHLDALPGKLWDSTLNQIKAAAKVFVPEDTSDLEGTPSNTFKNQLMGKVNDVAQGVNAFNQIQWRKQTKAMLGFDFDTSAAWWPLVQDQWAKRNYSLIKSLTDTYIGRVNDLTEQAVVSGTGYRDLMDQIDKMGQGLSESRARLIARDQVGKLNGRVSQGRMADVGINDYVWMTAEDDRVRGDPNGLYPDADPSHYAMDGMVCSWDDASIYSDDDGKTWQDRRSNMPEGGPGDDIQCRCTASPNWKPLLAQLDGEIDGAPADDTEE